MKKFYKGKSCSSFTSCGAGTTNCLISVELIADMIIVKQEKGTAPFGLNVIQLLLSLEEVSIALNSINTANNLFIKKKIISKIGSSDCEDFFITIYKQKYKVLHISGLEKLNEDLKISFEDFKILIDFLQEKTGMFWTSKTSKELLEKSGFKEKG